MKKIIILLTCLQSIILFGQAPLTAWVHNYGGSTADDLGRAAYTDNNGNVYTTGRVSGVASFGGVGSAPIGTTADVFISKTTANGTVEWVKRFGGAGSGHSLGTSIKVDNNGNIYVVGQFTTATITFNSYVLTRNSSQSGFVVKMNASGTVLWAKGSSGTTAYGGCYDIDVDENSNVYVTGSYNGYSFQLGGINVTSMGGQEKDCYIIKFDSNGNGLWGVSFGDVTGDIDVDGSVKVDNTGNILVTMTTYGNSVKIGTMTLNPTGVRAACYFNMNANGSVLWANTIESGNLITSNLSAQSLGTDAVGNVYIGGAFETSTVIGTTYLSSAGGYDCFIAKGNPSGTILWAKRLGSTGTDQFYAISTDSDGNIYVSASFATTTTIAPGITVSGSQLIKIDTNGNILWAKSVPINEMFLARNISTHVYATGILNGTKTFDSFSVMSSGTKDVVLVKLNQDCSPITHTISEIACGSYTWTTGNGQTYNTNTTATHTIVGGASNGCDSIVTLNLTINQPTSSSVAVTECESYTWPINNQTYTTSGAYTHVITNTNNCDSTITLNLTINQPTSSSVAVTECETYTWPINNQTYTTSGAYTHVIPNTNNCDSTITLNLTINQPTISSVAVTECEAYTWPLNNQTYATSGTYTHVIPNANNCDSTITLNLTINQPTSSAAAVTECESYTWSVNNQTYTTSGAYTHVIPNANNCDSTITLNLTINQSSASTLTQTACGSYTLNGQTYSASGTYTQVIPNANNCDSTITLNLTINNVNTTVTASGIVLTATQSGATYQWINCDNNDAPIAGATIQSFTPIQNGNYAVTITANGCTETSDCIPVNSVGIESVEQNGWAVYPNPGNGIFTVSSAQIFNNVLIEVYSPLGQLIYSTIHSGQNSIINLNEQPNGVYILNINKQPFRVVKL